MSVTVGSKGNTQSIYPKLTFCIRCRLYKPYSLFFDSPGSVLYNICNDCRFKISCRICRQVALLLAIPGSTQTSGSSHENVKQIKPNTYPQNKPVSSEKIPVVPMSKWRYQKAHKNKRYYTAKVVSLPSELSENYYLYSRIMTTVRS